MNISHWLRRGMFVSVFLLISILIVAQEDSTCPAIVDSALNLVSEVCGDTARNQACYGNLSLAAEPQPNVNTLQFESPGDIVDVAEIQSLRLSSMDEDVPEWGIALMILQANLPDTLPGQNVTFLLFGNVEVENNVVNVDPIEVTVSRQINARSGPSTDAEVIGNLRPGARPGLANARTANSEWLRVQSCSGGPLMCWVFASLVTANGDISTLPVIDPDAPVYRPLQAFTMKTGIGDSRCNEAPKSGILIQTPKGRGTINFNINGVDIALGSTVFLQAQAGGTLDTYVLEGRAVLTAFDEMQIAYAGTVIQVPLGDNLAASGPPTDPEPYNLDTLQSLPITLLETEIEIAEPLIQTSLDALGGGCTVTATGTTNLRSGPGTVYNRAGTLSAGEAANPIGQAEGTDGFIWWQLNLEQWVRSDLITEEGDCDSLPIVTDIPPVPSVSPVQSK